MFLLRKVAVKVFDASVQDFQPILSVKVLDCWSANFQGIWDFPELIQNYFAGRSHRLKMTWHLHHHIGQCYLASNPAMEYNIAGSLWNRVLRLSLHALQS